MFKIRGGNSLSGTIKIGGSKNAVLPIIAASVLIKGKVTLKNVPEISDVFTYLDILHGVGVKYSIADNILTLDSRNIKEADFDLEKIKKIRASILLLSPLLNRLGKVSIPLPGGCNLGARSITSHLEGLREIGYKYEYREEGIFLEGEASLGYIEINAAFGVTPTENLIIANVLREGVTSIRTSAIEPHVMNLIDFLRKAGAKISIRYDHTLIINGVKELKSDFECDIISDYIQSGTYMIIGALSSKKSIIIEKARKKDLYSFIYKLKEAGVKIVDLGGDKLEVFKSTNIKSVGIQTNIFPGFPTDLQSPFAVLMSQAGGTSNIHEILFEGRLGWLIELEKMGCNIDIINHHEAMINGKSELVGNIVDSWDLRAGAAMVIAGLIADGETIIRNVDYIHRGYENIINNLSSLGADIEEV